MKRRGKLPPRPSTARAKSEPHNLNDKQEEIPAVREVRRILTEEERKRKYLKQTSMVWYPHLQDQKAEDGSTPAAQ